jgi:hypothetical protein
LLLFTRKNKVIAESNGLQKYFLKNYELNYEKKKEIIPFHSSFFVSHFDTNINEIFAEMIKNIQTSNVE